MQDSTVDPISSDAPAAEAAVSPNNPCPFLRAVVAEGYVDGHVVPLSKLCQTVEAASGKTGLQKKLVGVKTCMVALIANGLSPLRLWRSWWSGPTLDALRDGPLDKHGVGSRILDVSAHVNEAELARLAGFGKDRPDLCGGTERGLTGSEIVTYMDANFERAKGHRRWFDRKLMNGEWPILLDIMGKGEGAQRYLSVAEVKTLFEERRLPERINARLSSLTPPSRAAIVFGKLAKAVLVVAVPLALALVAIAEFPEQVRAVTPSFVPDLLPPALPEQAPVKAAHWLDQNWSTEDRHWFHHASQGTATFPVAYSWFIALEQPGIHLFTSPGLLADTHYLERFGFIPSPKSVNVDADTLSRFGYVNSPGVKTEPAPESVFGLKPTPVDNFDGLPVGFSRMSNVKNPGTGLAEPDKIGLTCAACHTGSLRYQDVSLRFDGGAAMLDLRKLESATGLAIVYTLYVPGRFDRFATRVLGPGASKAKKDDLKKQLQTVGDFLKNQLAITKKTLKAKGQKDTDEGYGRLDALNRIGNQVFYIDLAASGLSDYANNLHANDAPVSFPPVWTVPWLWWAQYDASIEQPLIRNAGEALGVYALVNLSPDHPPEKLFSSSIALENLVRIEAMLRGPDPFGRDPKAFSGLAPPKWPSHLFPRDDAWKINSDSVGRGRALYAANCAECHLGPVSDPVFDTQFPDKSFWSSKNERWKKDPKGGWVLDEVTKPAAHIGTDPAQANVLQTRQVQIPGFLELDPARDLGERWKCKNMETYSSTNMPFSIALMIVVDKVSQKWLKENNMKEPAVSDLWGERSNCPNTDATPEKPLYRARPLNGVWATAPYLHNGSVPSLYWMLKPAAERPKQFCLGARDFDPRDVGFRVGAGGDMFCKTGETMFRMTDGNGREINGNSVLGHSFEAAPGDSMDKYKNGVIGRTLTDDERYDLIEYLKTL
jgi:hypothetical protein